MSSFTQALMMDDPASVTPGVAICEADQYFSCGPTNDPYWANVVLMCHFDGGFTDSSPFVNATTNSGCAIGTGVKKFGSGALQANGTAPGGGGNNSVETDFNAAFDINTGDWTVECWGYLSSNVAAVYSTLVRLRNSGGSTVITLALKAGTISEIYVKDAAGNLQNIAVATGVVLSTWFHMAVTRQGTAVKVFINGSQIASSTISVGISESVKVAIGNNAIAGTVGWDGFIDDLRITKGIARYTDNFNIPTAAFPDAEQTRNTSVNNALLLNFNGTNGSTTFTDSSPNAAVPTVFGGAVLTTDASKRTFGTAAGDFSASSSTYIRFAASTALQLTGAFTIRFTWIPASTGLTGRFFFGMSGGNSIWLKTDGAGFIACHCQGVEPSSTIAPQAGTKYHIVITKTSWGLKQWWINGAQQPAMNTDTAGMSTAAYCEIGAAPTLAGAGTGYPGYIDDLQILSGFAATSVWPPFAEFTQPQLEYVDPARAVLSLHAEPTASRTTSDAFNPTPVNTRAGVTFSNGNKTVAYVTGAADHYAAIATRARRRGKYYWEVYLTAFGNGAFMGFARRSVIETVGWIQQLQSTPATDAGNGSFYVTNSGATAYRSSSGPTLSGAGAGKTYMLAVDFDNAKIWIGINGVWHGSGDPAAGTNTTLTMLDFVPGMPVVSSRGDFGGGSNFTIRLSTADFAYPPPTGFSAWAATEDGTNDEFPTADSSCAQLKTVTLTGTASISTAEEKFGISSFLVPNTGSSTLNGVQVTDHQDFDFGTGDFTFDCWAYRTANTYAGTLFYYSESAAFSLVVAVTTGLVTLNYRSSGGTQASIATGVTFPLNTWQYVVVQRRGTNFEFYLHGALSNTTAITGGASSTVNSAGDLFIGRTNASSALGWNGYVDEFRVTKGAARYTAAFTPPTMVNCDSTSPTYTSRASGTEALTGVSATAATGTISAPNAFAALTGQSATVSTGTTTGADSNVSIALVGQAATALYTDYFYEGIQLRIASYPNFYNFPVPSTLHLAVTASNSSNQRCRVRLLLDADWSVSTEAIIADAVRSVSVPPYWLIDSSPVTGQPTGLTPAQVNNAFASSYTGQNGLITSGSRTGTSTFAMTNGVDMSAGAYWEIDVTDSATAAESFFSQYIILSPKTNNPRYGEFNYYGLFYFTISISAY